MTDIEQGLLLVAHPDLGDPNFQESVVLIVSHDADGSFGLILNRPLDRVLGDVLPDVDPRGARVPLLQGGPVQTDMVQFVSRREGCGRAVLAGVSIGAALEELLGDEAADGDIRAYVGYAGWGAGQLESETEEGSWIITPAHARHVFEVPAPRLWSEVLREMGGRYAWLAFKGGDAAAN